MPHGSQGAGDGQTPRRPRSPLPCHAPVAGLRGDSGAGAHLRLSCVYFKPVAGPPVAAGGAGGCSRPRLAGTIAGSLVPGGLRRWLLFGRALPLPPTTRARDHALAPRVMALQAACLPLVSIFGGRLQARPRARTGPIPAGETQPQVSAPKVLTARGGEERVLGAGAYE